jgi:hypothetical protein
VRDFGSTCRTENSASRLGLTHAQISNSWLEGGLYPLGQMKKADPISAQVCDSLGLVASFGTNRHLSA